MFRIHIAGEIDLVLQITGDKPFFHFAGVAFDLVLNFINSKHGMS